MIERKKNLCFFLHHFSGDYFPVYVQYYLNELEHYFDEVIMITNDRRISQKPSLLNKSVRIQFEKNEGYDFGLFYKGFQSIDPSNYNQIACINDSNVVFGKLNFLFDWGKAQQADVWGLVDSHEKPWFSEHEDSYHIQSHFVVFNNKAIASLPDFFKTIDYNQMIKERDLKKLRRKVINDWEIGLTQYLLSQNLTCCTFVDSKHMAVKKDALKPVNIFHKHYTELIEGGIPVIKKRLIMDRSLKSKLKFRSRWSKLIRKYGEKNWEIDLLIDDLNLIKNYSSGNLEEMNKHFKKILYNRTA
ncbi:rhamnan synthesis F family protein [Sunxiuqinia sp. sy24]|uniref:rhamnan synthesis F family protein n=1 Tax=Sunxiuqinia sp. sy24 TaxID=3461495 RepID=UPI004046785D